MDADLANIILRSLAIAMDEHPDDNKLIMEIAVAAARVYDPSLSREEAVTAVDSVLSGQHIH